MRMENSFVPHPSGIQTLHGTQRILTSPDAFTKQCLHTHLWQFFSLELLSRYESGQYLVLLPSLSQVHTSLTSRNKLVPWTPLNVLKLLINLALIILPLVDLFSLIETQSNGNTISHVHLVADIVRASGYLLALAFMLGCKVSSSFYWNLFSMKGSIQGIL